MEGNSCCEIHAGKIYSNYREAGEDDGKIEFKIPENCMPKKKSYPYQISEYESQKYKRLTRTISS